MKYKSEITIYDNGKAQFTTFIIDAREKQDAVIALERYIDAISQITNCNAIFYSPVEIMRNEQ